MMDRARTETSPRTSSEPAVMPCFEMEEGGGGGYVLRGVIVEGISAEKVGMY